MLFYTILNYFMLIKKQKYLPSSGNNLQFDFNQKRTTNNVNVVLRYIL